MSSDFLITEELDITDFRELGIDAVFNLSSAKPGNGVEQIRDSNLDTYWYKYAYFLFFTQKFMM
jgi:hypothetical protein